jgi:hypothetical protein
MKDSARYVKIVEWSDEDKCYVGSSPGALCANKSGTISDKSLVDI